jgi:hypothetical protein
MTPTSLSESTTVVATENTLSTTIRGETIILDEADGVYYGLNDVGSFIWNLIEDPHTIEEVCEAVTAEYEVERERCQRDIEEMISELADTGLVMIS